MQCDPDPAATLCPLGRYTLLAVDGDDAVDFLQGQLTMDVGSVTPGLSRLGALLTAKGRVLALVRAIRCDDRLMLLLPAELAPGVLSHLRRYVMRARVTLSMAADDYRVFGITARAETTQVATLADAVGAVAPATDGCLVRIASAGPLRLLGVFRSGRPGDLGGFAGATAATPRSWYVADIQAGLPEIAEPTRERFVVQMLNLDLLDGVSFDKGCYVGQEIVARTQNLGRIKRRMLGFRAAGGSVPAPGTPILNAGDPQGAAAGHVVRAAAQPGGGFALLGVMSLSELGRSLTLGETPLEPFALPYQIPELVGAG